jgi:hypothetical protein
MDNRYGIAVMSTQLSVAKGDPVGFYVAIANQSNDPLVVNFLTSQQYDFALRDSTGKEYWRWSTGMVFAQHLTLITVPGGPKGGFNVNGISLDHIPWPPTAGDFVTLVGELPSSNLPFAGTFRIATTTGS